MTDLSIIVTAHAEGIIAHKTILGILRCAEELGKARVGYEIIVGLDNPDSETEKYYHKWENDARFRIVKCSFGNPADNRNNAISKANGKYISLIDGDDIPSRNWLIESYKLVTARSEPVVIRPNFYLQFSFDSDEKVLNIMESSFSKEEDALILCFRNRWCATATAPPISIRK